MLLSFSMNRKIVLILAVVALVGVAGCMGNGGGAPADGGNGSVDSQQDDGSPGGGAMDGGSATAGMFGGCEAGQSMTFEEMRQQYEVQSMFQAGQGTPEVSEISGTVTFRGTVNHDGHETCHVVIEYDEAVGSGEMQLSSVEMYSNPDYVDLIYYDTNGTRRMQVTMEGNETEFTLYDEEGNEMEFPGGGQMPSGGGQMPR